MKEKSFKENYRQFTYKLFAQINTGLKDINHEDGTDGLYRNVGKLYTNQGSTIPQRSEDLLQLHVYLPQHTSQLSPVMPVFSTAQKVLT
jgi:hypothetical protein